MKPANRIAGILAELDAERARKPARVSFLLEQNGRIVELVVDVTPERPPARPGWSGAVQTDVGWFSCQIVQ